MMLNKQGQTLVLFIILIPILLLLAAFVIDMGVILTNKMQLKEVTKLAIKENVDNPDDINKIKKIFEINEIDISNLEINVIDNKINIKNEIEVKSIFGSVIGILNYKVKIDITGYKSNDKIIIE